MIFVQLFLTFFLIGAFTIGGGYAMLTLIEHTLPLLEAIQMRSPGVGLVIHQS